jgi:hypothetical protein
MLLTFRRNVQEEEEEDEEDEVWDYKNHECTYVSRWRDARKW